MDNFITDYKIKSYVEQIINRSYDIRNLDINSVSRDLILWKFWNWISAPEQHDLRGDTDELMKEIRTEFGNEAVEDTGRVDGRQTYEVRLSDARFQIVKLPQCYLVNAVRRAENHLHMSCRPPKEIICCMREFNDRYHQIEKQIEETLEKIAVDNTLCHISAVTGKGIVDGLLREGLAIPPIGCIRGTVNGRVVLYFADSDEKINSPLDHLRARLKRRFSPTRA